MMRLLVSGLAFGAIVAAGSAPAGAQEKTPANAFAFVRDNVADGSWVGAYETCGDNDDCWDVEGRIIGANFQNGSYCSLRFVIQTPTGSVNRDIDLARPFTIGRASPWGGRVYFAGPVRIGDGEVRSGWEMEAPSFDIAERVIAALSYLQTVCKPAGGPW